MLLYRRHYLALANVSQQAFRSLARRNQVPRLPNAPQEQQLHDSALAANEERDAFGYHPLEAVMLGIADALVGQASASREGAKLSVEAWPQHAIEAIRRVELGEVIFACFVTMSGKIGRVVDTKELEPQKVPSFIGVGTLGEVTSNLETMAEKRGSPLACVTLINVTPMIKQASHIFTQLTDGKSLTETMES